MKHMALILVLVLAAGCATKDPARKREEQLLRWMEHLAGVRSGVGERKTTEISGYEQLYESYPDSPFALHAGTKVVDHLIRAGDYSGAQKALKKMDTDYARLTPGLHAKWALVCYRQDDFILAHNRCVQLVNEFPDSREAKRSILVLPALKEKGMAQLDREKQ